MRLWKRGPFTFGVLALATLAVDFALNLIPGGGAVLAQIAVPLAACGLLYGSLAADRGGRPRLGDFVAIAGASAGALIAVIASSLIVFAAQALTAYAIGRINMALEGLAFEGAIDHVSTERPAIQRVPPHFHVAVVTEPLNVFRWWQRRVHFDGRIIVNSKFVDDQDVPHAVRTFLTKNDVLKILRAEFINGRGVEFTQRDAYLNPPSCRNVRHNLA